MLEEVQSVDAAEEMAELIAEELRQIEEAMQKVYDDLANTISTKLSSRMSSRKVKEAQWLESMRLYLGSLSGYNTITGDNPFGNAESPADKPETNITRNKCETAIAQTMAFQFAAGDKNWDLRPPQVLDLDEDDLMLMQQMAGQALTPEAAIKVKIDLMSREMQTHLENTNYGTEARRAGWDRVVLGTGILKGPTNATRLRKVYEKQQTQDGRIIRIPVLREEHVPRVYRVNPWYFFPDDSVTSIEEAADTIEVHPMNKLQLRDLAKNPGYIADEIFKALEEEPKTYTNSPFNDPAYLTQGINIMRDRYLVLEYHGPMSREDLEFLGKTPTVESPSDEYFVEVWVVNDRVIRLEFSNLEGNYRCPYAVCSWEPDPGSIFGYGIPMLVRDQQRVVNETFKMLLDNAGISAGPQVIVDTTLIYPADGSLECTPWKVWYTSEYGTDVSKAVQFFMPENAFEGLSALFSMSMQLADSESSIPNLAASIGAPTGAADSATGMAIAQQNASSPLFYKSEQWDDQITKPIIQMLYDWEMQYNPKDEIKGTFDVDVRTSTAFLQSALNQQKLERLRMEIANGSPVAEWINIDELAQASLMDMRLPYSTIIKTPEQVEEARQANPPQPDPNMIKAQAAMAEVEISKERLELERQKLQLEANQKYQQAIMEYQAQMRTDEIRAQEAQASVLKAQYDYQAKMAALASKDELHRAQIMANMDSHEMKQQTQLFLARGQMALKQIDQQQKQEEIDIKRAAKKGGVE